MALLGARHGILGSSAPARRRRAPSAVVPTALFGSSAPARRRLGSGPNDMSALLVHPRPRGDDVSHQRACSDAWRFIRARAETTPNRRSRSSNAIGSSAPARRRRTTGSRTAASSPVHPRPRGDDNRGARRVSIVTGSSAPARRRQNWPIISWPLLSGSSAPARRRHFEIARLCATPDSRCVRTIRISRQTTLQRPSAGYG